MKKPTILFAAAALLFSLWLLPACSGEPDIVFTGEVLDVYDQGFLISTAELDGTDKVSISYDKRMKPLDFTLSPGQTLEVTVLRRMRESYPVQATAVKVRLIRDAAKMPAAGESDISSLAPSAAPVKISSEEARRMMDEESGAIILDVRTQEEFDAGHIKGAVLLPDTEVADKAAELLPDKNALILIYCRSGRRSALAANTLAGMGYSRVYDFGGIIDWPYETVKE